MFNVEERSVWLSETFGTKVFFPDTETGQFDLSDIDPRSCTSIDVLGRSLPEPAARPQQHLFHQNRQLTVSATQPGSSDYQGFNSVLAAGNNRGGGRRSSDNSFSVKIVQARMTGSSARPDFRRTGQAYMILTERQANVEYILRELKEEFGDGHVLVTSDGLEIRDSPGTRGQLAPTCKFCVCVYVSTPCRWDFLETACSQIVCHSGGRPSSSKICAQEQKAQVCKHDNHS